MSDVATIELPPWAQVTERRRAHTGRVVDLLEQWADAFRLPRTERQEWLDAGRYHDVLRDAPEEALRALVDDAATPASMLHGPAAAVMLEREGETRRALLEAVRWHTVGSPHWRRTGRALYMADYLEPGRPFDRDVRASLARRVPDDFDGVFREVVRQRLLRALEAGHPLRLLTVDLWNSLQ